jgi:hypothetical protein
LIGKINLLCDTRPLMPSQPLRQAIEDFHRWRQSLLLPGHAVAGAQQPDPQLVLSSKLLKVFLALHPEHRPRMARLQLHFLDRDYTNRVKPEEWQAALTGASATL